MVMIFENAWKLGLSINLLKLKTYIMYHQL